jgi:MATE family multidrug resistance protein
MRYFTARWNGEGGYREVLALAIPLILSTGAWTVQLYVDRMFLSWYSAEAIAAAMPAGLLNYTLMSPFLGTAGYVETFVAQYYGAGSYHRIGPAVWQGVHVSVAGGLLMLCFFPLAGPIFDLVGHTAPVRHLEVAYFQILCLGGIPGIASSALGGFFAGMGRPWPVMWVTAVSTAVNLVLDYALIFGVGGFPELGIRGAAIATVISAVFSLVVFLALMIAGSNNRTFRTLSGWRPDKELFSRLLRFGVPSGMQFFLEMAGFTAFVLLVGRLGTVSLAATNIAFNINTLAFMPMIGAGIAVSVLVGQYLGKNRPDLAQKSTYSGFHLTFVYMTAVAAGYAFVPEIFVAPFAAKSDPKQFAEVYPLAVILLKFVALYSIFDTMNLIFASAVKGAGDTRFVMYMVVVLSGLILVGPTYLAVVVFGYGLMAPWVFATAYVIILGFAFYFRFLNGKWKTMRVIEGPPAVLPREKAEMPSAR